MATKNPPEYIEPDPLTPEHVREKLLELDRESRIEFMRLTVEPPETNELSHARSSRKRGRHPLAA